MSARTKGIVLAVLQILIVLSLGAKLLYDRSTRPRVWVLAQVYDPDLPMRGRYISQQLRMPAEGFDHPPERPAKYQYGWVRPGFWAYYQIRDGKLIASATGDAGSSGGWVTVDQSTPPQATAGEPVLLFIPDDAKIPRAETRRRNVGGSLSTEKRPAAPHSPRHQEKRRPDAAPFQLERLIDQNRHRILA